MEALAKVGPNGIGQPDVHRLLIQPHVAFLVAGAVVLAGHARTLLHVGLAVFPLEPVPTVATVVVDEVVAGGVVAARRHGALVNVQLAVEAGKAGVCTVAGVHVDPVGALAAVEAGRAGAVVDVDLAV